MATKKRNTIDMQVAEQSAPTLGLPEQETIENIRRVLLIGLHSYGEIERLTNAVELIELCQGKVPDELRPVHPTGCADTVSDFANALRSLEYIPVEQ